MATNRIELDDILSDDENAAIECFCRENRGEDAIPAMAAFLEKQFSISLATDPGIVEGFAADNSHLPRQALAVARPETEKECASVLRTCHKAEVPLTLSGGRSHQPGRRLARRLPRLQYIRIHTGCIWVNPELGRGHSFSATRRHAR